ncbi:PPOX class F420-dependent oxidoreductase [Mycobacterium sp.]|uniref:PPOX class F420-dependent oxidoreductase n=1 Tax=Mycobacterium sp. TaxID=1785 RepID=UPI002D137DA5|nr:PPOX class F420-dependent oxidoreductase [Mycobacterium sp.]HTY31221.1 PPOX class F420-dependent oxidoreductase [Mycobacterium sp.]
MAESAKLTKLSARVVSFLSAGTRTGMLGYVAADGRPLVAPVWFVVDVDQDGGQLVFTTGRDTSKGRALARDSRVVMCVDDPHPPYSFVQVQGLASVGEDAQDVLDIATRTGGRYMGANRADEFGRRNAVPGELVVRVRPTKVIAAFDISD